MFFADIAHPYSVKNRQAEFAGAFMTTFFGAGLLILIETDSYVAKFFISLALVTVPTAVFRKIAYYLFVAPCFVRDQSKTSDAADVACNCCTACFAGLGYTFACVWALVFFIVGLIFWLSVANGSVAFIDWMVSIAQFWVIWFVVALTMDFNPFPCPKYLRFLNRMIGCLTCGMVPTRIGRWHLERKKVHEIIREKVKERGIDKFFLPESQRVDEDADDSTKRSIILNKKSSSSSSSSSNSSSYSEQAGATKDIELSVQGDSEAKGTDF